MGDITMHSKMSCYTIFFMKVIIPQMSEPIIVI